MHPDTENRLLLLLLLILRTAVALLVLLLLTWYVNITNTTVGTTASIYLLLRMTCETEYPYVLRSTQQYEQSR